jgi:pectate lyase
MRFSDLKYVPFTLIMVVAGQAIADTPDDVDPADLDTDAEIGALAATSAVGYGAATTGGGSKAAVNVSTMAAMQAAIDAYDGTSGLVLNYTGTFNFATITVCAQWQKDAQIVQIKKKNNITIIGANGSSANFGIHIAGPSSNVIVRNMTIGLLPGGEDADSISIEGMSSGTPSNIWIDHNRFENVKSRLPLQRFGLTHIYNNYFKNVATSGINVRMGGLSLIESNVFETVKNPVTSRDSSAIGFWDLRNNIATGITWDAGSSGTVNATNFTTTRAFGSTGYSYTLTPVANVKANVLATAGAGTNLAQ